MNNKKNGYLLIISAILLGAITDILFTSRAKKTEKS